MRIWTLHPKYLDPQGLVALWREALLAKAVLRGETRGYRHHPQLQRFQAHPDPRTAINAYLRAVHGEAAARGYAFDTGKLEPASDVPRILATRGQLHHEWQHLMTKLAARNPEVYERWRSLADAEAHPLFALVDGVVEPWERV
jgi:hypothetical protein